MSKVSLIPARRQVGNTIKQAEKPKLRVAAYCRVSTDSDEQATSYEAQIEHYTNYIKSNSEWTQQASSLMMVFPVPTPKSVKNSTV